MTITRDNQQSATTTTGGTSYTLSYTVNSGSNRLLVVTAHFMRNSTTDYTTSATWDGNSMSKAAEATATSTNRRTRVVVFYTIAPDVKTADIVITASATMAGFGLGAVTLQGAAQSSPVGSTITDTTNPAASLALTGLTAGSMVYALAGSDSGSTPTWSWSTATEAYDFNNGNDNAEVAGSGGYFTVPSSGNHTLTATRSSSGAHQAAAAAEFFEASAATHSVRLVNPRGRLVINAGGILA